MRWFIASIITAILLIFPLPRLVTEKLASIVPEVIPPVLPPISADQLVEIINNFRIDNGQSVLPTGQKTCLMADSALNNQQLDATVVAQKCPECQSVQIARFSQPLNAAWFTQQIDADASISAYLLAPQLTHMCVATSSAEVVISLVAVKPVATAPLKSTDVKNFSEAQLWQALATYRRSQGRSELPLDEHLCQYARKRVQDQLDLYHQQLEPSAYPVAAKYPLDAHQGFKQDGDSGLVFEITQKTQVAENLAYWPNAQDPIHVVEWGWDTSTEGHRETQLSNDWTSVCLSGQDGFYVAIFGK